MRTDRFFLVSCTVGALIAVAMIIALKQVAGAFIGMYATAALMVGRSAVLVALRRPLDLVVGGRTVRGRVVAAASVGAFVVLTLMREGVLGGALAYDFSWNTATTQLSSNTTNGASFTTTGPRTWLRELKIECTISANPGDVGDGFVGRLHCDPASTGAHADARLQANDAFCHLPLYASATVPYSVAVSFNWSSPTTSGSGSLQIGGTISRTQTGFGSCRAFNQAIGQAIADETAKQMNAFIAAN